MEKITNRDIYEDIATLKEIAKRTQDDISELKEKILGNGREGLIARVTRLEQTNKLTLIFISVGIPLLLGILKFLKIVI